jgi:hypothetical protein
MPIEPHPSLTPPANSDRIWRYMDFPKYVSMLEVSSLYFCNVETLARTDPHEGALAQPNFRHRSWKELRDLTPEEWRELSMDGLDDEGKFNQFWSHKNSREYLARRRFYDRRACFANCWHINEYESAAMWSVYAPAEYGIAVIADYSRVVEALTKASERVFATKVQYVDFAKEPAHSELIFPIHKHRSFSYEQELRLLYWDLDIQEPINKLCTKLAATMFRGVGQPVRTPEVNWELIEDEVAKVKYDTGRNIAVDALALVDEVRVSPLAGDWFVDLVRSVSRRYFPTIRVTRSDISSPPIR